MPHFSLLISRPRHQPRSFWNRVSKSCRSDVPCHARDPPCPRRKASRHCAAAGGWAITIFHPPVMVASGSVSTIVVAAGPLEYGTTLTGDNLSEAPWESSIVPEGAFAFHL